VSLVRVAAVDDLWIGEMRGYEVRGEKVVLVRTDDGIFAYEDRCAHLGLLLSKGKLDGSVLTCAAHGWQYDVCTRAGVNPRCGALRAYVIQIENNDVFVDVESSS
jgi:toluene monooxygenase system ferredoxin subunit